MSHDNESWATKRDAAKEAAGRRAMQDYAFDGMRFGAGTGSTAVWAIRQLADMIDAGVLKDVRAVPTSYQAKWACEAAGIPVSELNDPAIGGRVDLAIDGADEVDGRFRLIKGGGGALLMEKIVETNAEKLVIVVDEAKLVSDLGTFPIPVEVVPAALVSVCAAIRAIGGEAVVRPAVKKSGPVITDNGNLIIDVSIFGSFDPCSMEQTLIGIPGVVEVGIFTMPVTAVYVGSVIPDGTVSVHVLTDSPGSRGV